MPAQAERIASSSVMSAWRKSIRSKISARFSWRPCERSSIPRTCSPRATNACAIFDPMKPSTQVIRYLATLMRIANLFFSFSRPGQNASHLLWRDGEPLGHARDLLSFFLPHFGNHDLSKLLSQFLERLFAGNALRPGAQQRVNASARHDFLLQHLQLFPEIVIIHGLQE